MYIVLLTFFIVVEVVDVAGSYGCAVSVQLLQRLLHSCGSFGSTDTRDSHLVDAHYLNKLLKCHYE